MIHSIPRILSRYRIRRSRARGYTAVEVLIAMTLFAIGAAGVIGMQRTSIQANADARRLDTASAITAEWLARLRRDSMMWTEPNDLVTTSNHATRTVWLGDTAMLATPLPKDTGWRLPIVPPASPPIAHSYAFDITGRETIPAAADTFYCVNYRLDWLSLDPGNTFGRTIRAEVRVFYPRVEQNPTADCAPTVAQAGGDAVYHFVYATTTLRRNGS